MKKKCHIILIADFINDKKSIASRRQNRIREALSKYGTVELLTKNLENTNKIEKSSISTLKKLKKFDEIRKKWGAFRSHRFPDGQEINYIKLALDIKVEPDLIVASFGPYSTLLCAYILKKRFPNAKLWIDYRDLYYNNPNYSGIPIINIIEKKFNKLINNKADKITTVSIGLALEIPNCIDPIVVYNDAEPSLKHKKTAIVKEDFGDLVIGYFGTYYDYYIIDGLIEYIKSLKFNVKLITAGDCKKIKELFDLENIENLSVEYRGMKNKDIIKNYQVECDREVYFSSSHVGFGILSGKIFEYVASNTPVVVVGKIIDEEVAKVLDKISDVIYETDSYCLLSYASSTPIQVVKDFGEVIDEIFV